MQQSMIAAVEWKAPIFYWACCCWLLFIQRLGLCVCMRKYKKSALRLSSWIVAVHALWVIIWQCVCKHVRLKALLAAQHPLCVPYTQLNYRHRNFDFPIFIFVIGLSALRPVVVAKKKVRFGCIPPPSVVSTMCVLRALRISLLELYERHCRIRLSAS